MHSPYHLLTHQDNVFTELPHSILPCMLLLYVKLLIEILEEKVLALWVLSATLIGGNTGGNMCACR